MGISCQQKVVFEGQIEGQGIGVSIPTSLPAFTRFFVGMGSQTGTMISI